MKKLLLFLSLVFLFGCSEMKRLHNRAFGIHRDYRGYPCEIRPLERTNWGLLEPQLKDFQPNSYSSFKEKKDVILEEAKKVSALPDKKVQGKGWPTPSEVEDVGGVCIGKSILLLERLRVEGIDNLRLVVGQHRRTMRGHAWLQWFVGDDIYIIDVMGKGGATVIRVGQFGGEGVRMWNPQYSMNAAGSWCHNPR